MRQDRTIFSIEGFVRDPYTTEIVFESTNEAQRILSESPVFSESSVKVIVEEGRIWASEDFLGIEYNEMVPFSSTTAMSVAVFCDRNLLTSI